ncbi:hypothetical protein P9112_003371 [Eukaryota sp. TZLM1-RC]
MADAFTQRLHSMSKSELIDLVLHYRSKCQETTSPRSTQFTDSTFQGTRFSRIKTPPRGYWKKTSPSTPKTPRSSTLTPAPSTHESLVKPLNPYQLHESLESSLSTILRHIQSLKKELIVTPLSQRDRKRTIKQTIQDCSDVISDLKFIQSICSKTSVPEKLIEIQTQVDSPIQQLKQLTACFDTEGQLLDVVTRYDVTRDDVALDDVMGDVRDNGSDSVDSDDLNETFEKVIS